MSILSARRYFLRKSQELDLQWLPSLAGAYRAKQAAMPGAPLPATFPMRTKLAAARYTTQEDLRGAELTELIKFVGLNWKDAQTVLSAIAVLL